MKSKRNAQSDSSGIGPFEIAFLVLPLIALTPNNFIPPPLGHQGLATQEFVFACATTAFAAIGAICFYRSPSRRLALSREQLSMFASLAAFIIWMTVSLTWAPTLPDGLRLAGIWLGFAVFFTAGVLALRAKSADRLQNLLSAITAVLAVSVIYERIAYGGEMRGIFFNHGISAELIVTLLPFQVLAFLTKEDNFKAFVYLVIAGLSAGALLMGLRRAPIIAAVVIMIAIGLAAAFKLIESLSASRIAIAAVIIIAAAAAVGVRYRDEIIFRIEGATRIQSVEGGLSTRLRSWITAWEMGKSRPLIGVGIAGYPSLYGSFRQQYVSNPRYAPIADSAGAEDFDEIRSPLVHNEYLETFAELGIIGLALFFAFWFQVVRSLWRRMRDTADITVLGSLLGLIAFGISAFSSGFSLRYTPQVFILSCVIGIGFGAVRKERNPSEGSDPYISFPKYAGIAIAAIGIIAGAMFVARTYNVMASQQIQGSANAAIQPIDFQYFPDNPSGNESLANRYEQVLDLDPGNAGAHLGYGLLLFQMERPDKAIPHVEFALRHGYGRPFTHVLLAFCYEQSGNLAHANEILRNCASSFPGSIFVRASYAELLRLEGRLDEAKTQQKVMYRLGEFDARSWELAVRKRPVEAAREAKARGLILPDELFPVLAGALVKARAYHYLKE